ncbi:MAG TPA: hypothetical protein VF456_19320 [Vicinamibacterales bacterium]
MAGVDIGGDGSVQWHAWGDNIKPGKEVVKNRGVHGREHQNVDNTDPGENFRVTIKVPIDTAQAAAFLAFFTNVPNTLPGGTVYFELPIIEEDTDQIHVEWNSSKTFAPPGRGAALKARVAVKRKATKRVRPARKAKKTGKGKAVKKKR